MDAFKGFQAISKHFKAFQTKNSSPTNPLPHSTPSIQKDPSSIALAKEERTKILPLAETLNFPLSTLNSTALQSLQNRPAGKPRNGKIAHLPKLERNMVNRMLAKNLPHRKIVSALQECDFQVTERNVSNWKTRGPRY